MSSDTQTHTHTIKPPTGGVQLVGHTSIIMFMPVCRYLIIMFMPVCRHLIIMFMPVCRHLIIAS